MAVIMKVAVFRDMMLYSLISPDEGGTGSSEMEVYICQTQWHYI